MYLGFRASRAGLGFGGQGVKDFFQTLNPKLLGSRLGAYVDRGISSWTRTYGGGVCRAIT